MEPSPEESAAQQRRSDFGACFFLSYARTPRVFEDGPDPNYWVKQFYRDLCDELVSRDRRWHRDGHHPGFIDDSIRGGAVWSRHLAGELAACRVFLPLYSRAYFDSEYCGREWAVFRDRQTAHLAQTGTPNEAVIPVLWQPVRFQELPPAAAAVQLPPLGGSSRYLERGLFELIRLDRDREYLSVIIRLAEHLDETARSAPPPPGPVVGLEDVRPLFPDELSANTSTRRLHISVAAHDTRSVPPGRDLSYYGDQPEDWNPYHPESAVPLLSRAEDVARGLGYTPVVDAQSAQAPSGLAEPDGLADPGAEAEGDPDGPELFLVDPWMVDDPAGAARIAELDRRRQPWARVLIPWSRSDAQTGARAKVLRAKLLLTMPWSMGAWRRTARSATRDLGTLAEFGHALPAVVEQVWSNYIKAVGPKPPPGEHPRRPKLNPGEPMWGPGSGTDPDPPGGGYASGGSP